MSFISDAVVVVVELVIALSVLSTSEVVID